MASIRDRIPLELTPSLDPLIGADQDEFYPFGHHGGGMVYVDGWYEDRCAKCANELIADLETADGEIDLVFDEDWITDGYELLEGGPVYCYECNQELEPAYPEEEEDDGD